MVMTPVVLGTKNYCAGEDQQQLAVSQELSDQESGGERVTPSRGGVTGSSQTPLVKEEEATSFKNV
jgi:hypothetical protein